MTELSTKPFTVTERLGWHYVSAAGAICDGPFRYRHEAQDRADELNSRRGEGMMEKPK